MTFKTNLRAQAYLIIIALFLSVALGLAVDAIETLNATWWVSALAWFPFAVAVASVAIDLGWPDHVTAAQFNTYETMISLQTRLRRNLFLIVYPQIVLIGHVLWVDMPKPADLYSSPFVIMISAIFATVGWLYSNYMTQVNARAQATIAFIKESQSDDALRLNERALRKFIRKASRGAEDDTGNFVFTSEMVEELQTRRRFMKLNGDEYQFRDVCSFLLAHHEYVGLAVRTGNFHFDIIQRQRKRITISLFNTLINVILQDCGARTKKWPSRYPVMPHSDRWENFIWLVMTMDGSRKISEHIKPSHLIDMRRYSAKRDPHHTIDLHPLDEEETV
jgi:hypothetical protein